MLPVVPDGGEVGPAFSLNGTDAFVQVPDSPSLSITGATTLAVALTGLADDARRVLGFGFGGVPQTPADAGDILLHNARLAAGMGRTPLSWM